MIKTIFQRFETRDYHVKASFLDYGDGRTPTTIHVNVVDRGDKYACNHTYFYETSRRRGTAIRFIEGHDRRFVGNPADGRLSKWSDRPGESVARRFARAILTGCAPDGECGCKVCGGSGFLDVDNLTVSPVCSACAMTGRAAPVPA